MSVSARGMAACSMDLVAWAFVVVLILVQGMLL
jgi:hypothetical protein